MVRHQEDIGFQCHAHAFKQTLLLKRFYIRRQ